MQPPPFEAPGGPVRKKSSALPWLIGGGVLVCCVGPLVLGGVGGYMAVKGAAPMVGCTIAMTGISRAIQDYAQEHEGKLPPAATWQSDIAPYYDKMFKDGDESPLTIPPAKEPFGCGEGADKTAFVFNSQYGGKKLADIKDRDAAILVFETKGPAALNRSAPYKEPPKGDSPTIFGQPRGWFALNADFDSVSVENGRQTPMGGRAGRGGR